MSALGLSNTAEAYRKLKRRFWNFCDKALDRLEKRMPKGARIAAPRALPLEGSGAALDVPCKLQLNTYNCGLVAVLTLIETFHPHWRNHARVVRSIRTTRDWGTETREVLAQLRQHGVGVVRQTDLTFTKIENAINAGYPVLAIIIGELPTRSQPLAIHHWCVIYGYDYDRGHVYVSNATTAKRRFSSRIPWEHFRKRIIPGGAFWRCHGLARR